MIVNSDVESYEVSNFARDNQDRSQHNSWYWRGGDFIGIGPGSHGRYHIGESRITTIQVPSVNEWIESVRTLGHGTRKAVPQSHYDIAIELLGK